MKNSASMYIHNKYLGIAEVSFTSWPIPGVQIVGMAQRAWNRLFTSVSDDEKFMIVVLVVYNVKKNSVKSSLTVN